METLWFALAAVMVAIYVVLDGFDFGAGALHLVVARTDRERRQVLGGDRPVLGRQRGLAARRRRRPLPRLSEGARLGPLGLLPRDLPACSGCSSCAASRSSSARTSATACGAASGTRPSRSPRRSRRCSSAPRSATSLRGVPLDADGWFALPLFDSFSPTGALGILDWYTVLVGVFALVAIAPPRRALPRLEDRRRGARAQPRAGGAALPEPDRALARARPSRPRGSRRDLRGGSRRGRSPGLRGALPRRARRELPRAPPGPRPPRLPRLVRVPARPARRHRGRDLPDHAPSRRRSGAVADRAQRRGRRRARSAALFWWPVGFVLAVGYFVLLFRLHRERVGPVTDHDGY